MATRKAACDPCRRAKLACDHREPICARCERRGKTSQCVYRSYPFKRSSKQNCVSASQSSTRSRRERSVKATPLQRKPYPNPGHLGCSSHAAIFNHILSRESSAAEASTTPATIPLAQLPADPGEHAGSEALMNQVAQLLEHLLGEFNVSSLKELVKFWLAKGVSLALAEPIVLQCTESVERMLASRPDDLEHPRSLVMWLLQNSARQLSVTKISALTDFVDQFCDRNIRWETFGIFLSASIRATFDVPFFPSVYTTEADIHRFRRLATALNNCVLELCLSLDCLNDLQLIFQYEHWIVLSYVYGDQSLRAWRTLGDVIASIFALGYHESIEATPNIPLFLTDLRMTAFARAYSGDKNVSIFLGRPPRMSKKFARFQIPSGRPNFESDETSEHSDFAHGTVTSTSEMSYRAETCWSALCASIKEDILELLSSGHRNDSEKIKQITRRTQEQWQALPAHFRLDGCLRQYSSTPFQCDFLLSTRLNYLHVNFLLQFALLDHLTQPNDVIVEIAQQILSLVVEGVLLRNYLVNSGTGLIWKIAHYGLPAAGIILLAMLMPLHKRNAAVTSRGRVWRDLTVLVAEIQMGSIVREGDANYALLSKATKTIQTFLDSEIPSRTGNGNSSAALEEYVPVDDWLTFLSPDPWNLEIGFWDSLGEHSWSSTDPTLRDVQ